MVPYFSKDFRLKTRVSQDADPDVSHVKSTLPQPDHVVEISIFRGVSTPVTVKARITAGAGSLLSVANGSANPDRWEKRLVNVQYGKPGTHAEAITVHTPSGNASVAVDEVQMPGGFGSPLISPLLVEIDLQVN